MGKSLTFKINLHASRLPDFPTSDLPTPHWLFSSFLPEARARCPAPPGRWPRRSARAAAAARRGAAGACGAAPSEKWTKWKAAARARSGENGLD